MIYSTIRPSVFHDNLVPAPPPTCRIDRPSTFVDPPTCAGVVNRQDSFTGKSTMKRLARKRSIPRMPWNATRDMRAVDICPALHQKCNVDNSYALLCPFPFISLINSCNEFPLIFVAVACFTHNRPRACFVLDMKS